MVAESQSEVEITDAEYIAGAIAHIGDGLHAIAAAVNRLADATSGTEVDGISEEEVSYLDGKRR